MARIWSSSKVSDWLAAEATYPDALATRALHPGDAQFIDEILPATLLARAPAAYLTQPELSRVMRWKLRFGKMRPLQKLVDALPDAAVRAASAAAFAALPPQGGGGAGALARSLAALAKPLKGVGPATASAVLAAWAPSRVAFMSDEALEGVVGSRGYTAAECESLAAACRDKAAALGAGWTAQRVQRVLWAAAVLGRAPAAGGAVAGKKRSRE
jgi:hypothetical protein